MEQKLQIQWQKFGPDHGKCRKTQTAFEQLHPGKKYFCRIAQSLPDHRHAAGKQLTQPQCRTVQLNRYRSFAALTALQKSAQPRQAPCAAKRPWHGTFPKAPAGC